MAILLLRPKPFKLLDKIPGASTAYSARRLSMNYSGPVIRIRRDFDNSELDIGLTSAGDLDTTALQDFVGSQNLIPNSEDISNISWAKVSIPITGTALVPVVVDNDALSPTGTMTADRVTFNATGAGDSNVSSSTSNITAGTSYASAIWLKAATASDVGKIILHRQVGRAAYKFITLTSEWQKIERVEVAFNTTSFFSVAIRPSQGSSSGEVSVHIWGAQLNIGTVAQPYLATGSSLNLGDGLVITRYDQSGNGVNSNTQFQLMQNGIINTGMLQSLEAVTYGRTLSAQEQIEFNRNVSNYYG